MKETNKKLVIVFSSIIVGLSLFGCQNPFLQFGKESATSPFMQTPTPEAVAFQDGTEEHPFLVYDIVTLKRVGTNEYVDGSPWALDKHYLQINDIDWAEAGEEWAPIGDYSNHFSGSYNGGGKTISNLECITDDHDIGLFGYIHFGARVKNLKLRNVNFQGWGFVGGIAARSEGEIQDCSIMGNISGHSMVGGIAGQNMCLVERCSAGGTFSCSAFNGGGLIGDNNFGTVRDCYAAVDFVDSSSCSSLGGIAGDNIEGSLMNCYADVAPSGSGYVGGITGNLQAGTIKNCVALGESVDATYNSGRIAGAITSPPGSPPSVLSNNYTDSKMLVNGALPFPRGKHNDYNGQDVNDVQYKLESWWTTSTNWAEDEAWDFENVWEWDDANELPVLQNTGGQ